jgi:transcription elongation factor GreA
MNEEPTYISAEGLANLKNELHTLKTEKRKEVAKRIYEAKELGDLSENAEYHDAKNEQSFIEGRIIQVDSMIKTARIIDEKKPTNNVVSIGCTISVTSEQGQQTYSIVGSNEADPLAGKISNKSPLGKAFLGHKIGDTFNIEVPRGTLAVTISEIK